MSHSKRNTSLAFFTSYERSLLKGAWGSQSTRLTRDSFLPFGSCQLCLQIAREPVACSIYGEMFCRECAVNNLLSQRKEIKRLEKELAKGLRETAEEDKERDEEEKLRSIDDFEKTMVGLEEKGRPGAANAENRGVKRKQGIDEEEMLQNARDGQAKARKAIDDEKAAVPKLPSFWVPSLTPSTKKDRSSTAPPKLNPLCPASSPANKHNISLKTLITVNFKTTKEPSSSFQEPAMICPACVKALNNTNKAVMTIPCGHVLCKPCAGKLMSPDTGPPDPHAPLEKQATGYSFSCYVCSADLGSNDSVEREGKKKSKKTSKTEVKAGLVELKCEGTGFAGGGGNIVQKHGTAFQC